MFRAVKQRKREWLAKMAIFCNYAFYHPITILSRKNLAVSKIISIFATEYVYLPRRGVHGQNHNDYTIYTLI